MPQWFYQDGDETVGPFKASDLLHLVRDGVVTAITLVRKDESAWFPAAEVGGLFAAAARSTVEYSCPECGSKVGKPPCYCRQCRRLLEYARPRVLENHVEGYEKPETSRGPDPGSWKQWVLRLQKQRPDRFKTE